MSMSLIFEVSGITRSIGIYFMGITKSGSPSDIFYIKNNLYVAEKARKIWKFDTLLICCIFLYFIIQLS